MEKIFEGLEISPELQEKLSERFKSEIEAVKEGVKNDSEFINSLKSAEAGKIYGSLERIFGRNFELESDKYADLKGNKKMEAMLKDGIQSLADTKDATSQEWQQKYMESQETFKKYQEEEVPTILEKERNNFFGRFIGNEILKDALEYETTIANDFKVPTIETYLHKNGYVSKWDAEKETYEILTADGVRPTKNDKVLSKKEIIEDAFETAGVLVKNNGTPPEGQAPGSTVAKSNGKLSANAQRMMDTMTVDKR